jgi:hypothetical protein
VFLFNSETKAVIFVDILDVQQATKEKDKGKKRFGIPAKNAKSSGTKWIVKVKTNAQSLPPLSDFSVCRLIQASQLHATQFPKK